MVHGVSPETLDAIAVCVSEAVTNVVMHAYRDRSEAGLVELTAYVDDDGSLWIHVRDQGHGLAPRPDSSGLGIGLPIISQMATAMAVRTPEEGGTEIVMEFELRQAAGASWSLTLDT
jgi:serine/threonine-protein kinase RsbW/stage II sporulation protein AB (anti-sigma F factor)